MRLVGALIVLIAISGCISSNMSDSDRMRTTPPSSPNPSAVPMPTEGLPPSLPVLKKRCPDAALNPQFPPDGRLPNGALQVRICNFTGDKLMGVQGHPELDFAVPVDALSTEVDQVVNLVNEAAKAAEERSTPEGGTFCAGVGAPTQVFWFTYPETDFAVTYNAGACDDLKLGETEFAGGKGVAARLSDLLWEQRSNSRPPRVRVRASCSPNVVYETPLILSQDLVLVDAVLCEYPVAGGVRQARLTSDALARVNADFRITDGYTQGKCRRAQMLRAVTSWGDVFTMWGGCSDFAIQNTAGSGNFHWRASPKVWATIGGLRLGPVRKQDTSYPGP